MTIQQNVIRAAHCGRLIAGAFALTVAVIANLTACGHKDDNPLQNQRPSVLITGGVVAIPPEKMERDSVSYAVEVLWTGWDSDGIIDHYQYTFDVPDDLIDRIDDPEDTGIAWIDTTAFRASFVFNTPEQDSVLGTPIERFRGDHTFYVRAVDNEGLVSKADYVTFTATNITPKTTITVPSAAGSADVLVVGRQFNIVWEGLDPDNPNPTRQPAYYEWKLKQMPKLWNPTGRDAQYSVDVEAAEVPWIRISRDTTSLRLSLQTGFPYILAVRAVDEAGGVETKFIKGQNTLILDSSAFATGTPKLTVRERSQGSFEFPGPAIEFEMAAGACVRFEMTGDASDYGGLVQGYNWGVDVDPDMDGPGSGFRGWSLNRFTDPICFDQAGIHTVVLKSRDTGGGVTTGIIVLRVINFAFDREMLYVDDFRRSVSQGFRDATQDQRNRDMLRAGGIPVDDPSQFAQFDLFGPGDQQGDPTELRLSDISAYKLIYWDCLGSALARNPGLVRANACNSGRILQAYVSGGGGLWVAGQTVFAGFDLASGSECLANNAYEFGTGGEGLNFAAGDFPCEFMQICGGGFQNVRSAVESNGLVRVDASPEGASIGLKTLEIDRTVFNNVAISFSDAMTTPTFDGTGGLDTLYVYRSPRTTSGMHGKPNGFRYRDPNPMPVQGPIAVFGFPLFYMQQGSVAEGTGTFGAAKLIIDWMKSEQDRYFDARGSASSGNTLPTSWVPTRKETR